MKAEELDTQLRHLRAIKYNLVEMSIGGLAAELGAVVVKLDRHHRELEATEKGATEWTRMRTANTEPSSTEGQLTELESGLATTRRTMTCLQDEWRAVREELTKSHPLLKLVARVGKLETRQTALNQDTLRLNRQVCECFDRITKLETRIGE